MTRIACSLVAVVYFSVLNAGCGGGGSSQGNIPPQQPGIAGTPANFNPSGSWTFKDTKTGRGIGGISQDKKGRIVDTSSYPKGAVGLPVITDASISYDVSTNEMKILGGAKPEARTIGLSSDASTISGSNFIESSSNTVSFCEHQNYVIEKFDFVESGSMNLTLRHLVQLLGTKSECQSGLDSWAAAIQRAQNGTLGFFSLLMDSGALALSDLDNFDSIGSLIVELYYTGKRMSTG